MNRSRIFASVATAVVSLALAASEARAQGERINKQQLVGIWKLVSADNTKADGTKVDVFGQSPKGILIFDRNGNYSLTIVRSDLPKFAVPSSDKGSASENKAVMAGMIASFGTYTLDVKDGTITTHVEGSSFPNLAGGEQKRVISSLTKDDLSTLTQPQLSPAPKPRRSGGGRSK